MCIRDRYYDTFLKTQDLSALVREYDELLVNRNKSVRVLDPKEPFDGKAMGITPKGCLLYTSILNNMVVLGAVGQIVEKAMGHVKLLITFLVSGMCGSCLLYTSYMDYSRYSMSIKDWGIVFIKSMAATVKMCIRDRLYPLLLQRG